MWIWMPGWDGRSRISGLCWYKSGYCSDIVTILACVDIGRKCRIFETDAGWAVYGVAGAAQGAAGGIPGDWRIGRRGGLNLCAGGDSGRRPATARARHGRTVLRRLLGPDGGGFRGRRRGGRQRAGLPGGEQGFQALGEPAQVQPEHEHGRPVAERSPGQGDFKLREELCPYVHVGLNNY